MQSDEELKIKLRAPEEIQAAHDRLTAIVLNEVPNPFTNTPQEVLTASLDVLCWVLHHDHNPNFERNLAAVDSFFAASGLQLRDSGKLMRRDPKSLEPVS
jgi:hypothetical protein